MTEPVRYESTKLLAPAQSPIRARFRRAGQIIRPVIRYLLLPNIQATVKKGTAYLA